MFFLKYFGCSLRRNSKWSFVGTDSLGFLVQVHSLYQYIEVMSLRNSDPFRNFCVICCMRSSLYTTFFLLSLHYYGSKKCLLLRGCYLTILCNTFPWLLRLTLECSNPPPPWSSPTAVILIHQTEDFAVKASSLEKSMLQQLLFHTIFTFILPLKVNWGL